MRKQQATQESLLTAPARDGSHLSPLPARHLIGLPRYQCPHCGSDKIAVTEFKADKTVVAIMNYDSTVHPCPIDPDGLRRREAKEDVPKPLWRKEKP